MEKIGRCASVRAGSSAARAGRQAVCAGDSTALGGVAILKDLDADTLDDLRMAADEMCDCLLHQGRTVDHLEVAVYDEGDYLKVAISACYGEKKCPCEDETEITRAVLQTLASDVEMTRCGDCVQCITLLLHKATAPLKKQ